MGLTTSKDSSNLLPKIKEYFGRGIDFLKKVLEIESNVKTDVIETLNLDEKYKNDPLIIRLGELSNKTQIDCSEIIHALKLQSIFDVTDTLKFFKDYGKDVFKYNLRLSSKNGKPICDITGPMATRTIEFN